MSTNRKWQELAWGEHLHMGLYSEVDDEPERAMTYATQRMAEGLPLSESSQVLEVACGIGQASRHLARTYGCKVSGTNIDHPQLEKAKSQTKDEGLDHLVSFAWGDFHQLDIEDASLDCWWCQESLVHSSTKEIVLQEALRTLKPGGIGVLSDLIITDDIEPDIRARIYSRIPTELIWTRETYAEAIKNLGFKVLEFCDWSENVAKTYDRAKSILVDAEEDILKLTDEKTYRETMDLYSLWVERAENGQIGWIYYRLQKN